MSEAAQLTIVDVPVNLRERLTRIGELAGTPTYELDVPETIPQLGYGSHQFFRYYGKFPSVVGGEIVRRHAGSVGPVLDCYAGSGTTLVEAQSLGLASFGIDINPLAVLACDVKTGYAERPPVETALSRVLARAGSRTATGRMPEAMPRDKLEKWFTNETQSELARLRDALLDEPLGIPRAFLLTAFLGIVRRVSTAHDGEIRPHVNGAKRPRSAVAAFEKKARQMIASLDDVNRRRPSGIASRSVLGDNRDVSVYRDLLGGETPSLVVAHPPYLNSFNYLSVFNLEFAWAESFAELWRGLTPSALRSVEHRAWPATDGQLVERYYQDFRTTMTAAVEFLAAAGKVAVVIGDATIRGRVEPVHRRMFEILSGIGLEPLEVWFRTTHYGIGKYAYRDRADYHGTAEKKDAVLVFTKR